MYYLLFALLIIFSTESVDSTDPFEENCKKLLVEIEDQLKDIFFVGNLTVPKDIDQLNHYENLYKNVFELGNKYKPCNQGLEREVFSTLISGLNRVNRQLLGTKSNKKKLLNIIKCFSNEAVESMRTCLDDYSNQITYMYTNVTANQTITAMCCTRYLGQQCVTDKIRQFCKEGSKDAIDLMNYMVDAVGADYFSLVCGDVKSIGECENTIPVIIENLRNVPNSKLKESDEFFVRPLLRVVRKLSNEQVADSSPRLNSQYALIFISIAFSIYKKF